MARTPDLPTRAEWYAITAAADLIRLLASHFADQVGSELAQRKRRLLACAVARTLVTQISGNLYADAVGVGERFAEKRATDAERVAACRTAEARLQAFERSLGGGNPSDGQGMPKGLWARTERIRSASTVLANAVAPAVTFAALEDACRRIPDLRRSLHESLRAHPSGAPSDRPPVTDPTPTLIRDVLGYPFAPVSFPEAWRTSKVRGLVQTMVTVGKFARLPVLAKALERAGCDDPDILAHCRIPGPHVRGCWVIDLVRGVHWPPVGS